MASPTPLMSLAPAAGALAELLEPYFAPPEEPGRAARGTFLSTPEQLLEGSAVLLRCLVVLADEQVTAAEEAHLAASGAALFADDEAVPFLHRLLDRLRQAPLARSTLAAALRRAYASSTRKLMLLLALEAAFADGEVQAEEGELIRELQLDLGVPEADGAVLRIVAGRAPLRAVDQLRAESAWHEALRSLHDELSPTGFTSLRGCPGLHESLQRAHAVLDELVRAADPVGAGAAAAPELELALDADLHAALLRRGGEVRSLGEQLVQLRIAAGGPEVALVGGLLKTLGEAHRRLASEGLSVAVLGEFGAGKSTLLDALVGEELLPSGGSPTTAAVTVVRFAAAARLGARCRSRPDEEVPLDPARFDELARLPLTSDFDAADDALDGLDLEQLTLAGPFPFCRSGIQLVDTPGWSDAARRAALTLRHVRESDLAIVVSNGTQPLRTGEREVLARLLDERPTLPVLLVVNHWDQVAAPERAAVQALYHEQVGALGTRGGRVVVRFVSAAKALSALRQRPVPAGDPWLDALRGLRHELLARLAGTQYPRRIEALRTGLLQVADQTGHLADTRLAELAQGDGAGAERDLRRLREAAAVLADALATAGEQFTAHAARLCAEFVDATILQLRSVASRWQSAHDPRWPGNTARIRSAFERQAQRHFERCLHDWSRTHVPALLAETIGTLEARAAESVDALDAALADLSAAPGRGGGLLSLVRVAGPWPLLGPAGLDDVSWFRIGAAMAGRLGPAVVADLLGRNGALASAVAAGVGLALIFSGKDDLFKKVRAGFLDGMRQDRERIVQAVREQCAAAARDCFQELSAQLRAGLDRLVEDREARRALIRDGGQAGFAQQQRLRRAQTAVAAVRQALAAPAAAPAPAPPAARRSA